jgi:hypothetical protein
VKVFRKGSALIALTDSLHSRGCLKISHGGLAGATEKSAYIRPQAITLPLTLNLY